jgi:arylsulfatase A-like enzyme
VIFTSDNGPTYAGGADSEFFASAGPLRGLKGSVWEGGIRVPFIARWPGEIKPDTETDQVTAFWDFLPTCAQLLDVKAPGGLDGVSIVPTLLAKLQQQKQHKHLYWELRGQRAARKGKWKAVRLKPDQKTQLFDLTADVGERNDLATQHPEVLAQMEEILDRGRTPSDIFPLRRPKRKNA